MRWESGGENKGLYNTGKGATNTVVRRKCISRHWQPAVGFRRATADLVTFLITFDDLDDLGAFLIILMTLLTLITLMALLTQGQHLVLGDPVASVCIAVSGLPLIYEASVSVDWWHSQILECSIGRTVLSS